MEKIKQIFGKNLLIAASYTVGDDKKALFVVEKLRFNDIVQLKERVKKGYPLILTKEEIVDGCDVFPLEYLNIQKTHRVLYGDKNLLKNLKINKSHVRRQLEYEFRSKLIHIREEFMRSTSQKELAGILKNAIPVLTPIFHGLLYLKDNKERCRSFEEYLNLLKLEYNVDFEILDKLQKGQGLEDDESVKQLMILLNTLSDVTDEFKG